VALVECGSHEVRGNTYIFNMPPSASVALFVLQVCVDLGAPDNLCEHLGTISIAIPLYEDLAPASAEVADLLGDGDCDECASVATRLLRWGRAAVGSSDAHRNMPLEAVADARTASCARTMLQNVQAPGSAIIGCRKDVALAEDGPVVFSVLRLKLE
jgi:hypothetical protein